MTDPTINQVCATQMILIPKQDLINVLKAMKGIQRVLEKAVSEKEQTEQ